MKRILSILLLCMVLPAGVFAIGIYGGVNAYYDNLIRPADIIAIDTAGLNLADFSFGGEVRVIAGPLWGSAVGIYTPGDVNLSNRVDLLLDGGLGLSLGFVRAGIGIGPNFGFEFGDNATNFFKTGANLRLTGDVLLGPLSLGLSWISKVEFTRDSIIDAFLNPYGQIGVAALYRF